MRVFPIPLALVVAAIVPLVSFAQGATPATGVSATTSTPIAIAVTVTTKKGELKIARVLKRGMTGGDVKALQEYLLVVPGVFPNGTATGYFGLSTEKAVKKFQKDAGLSGSGFAEKNGYGTVGPQTLAKINEAVARARLPAQASSASTTPAVSPAKTAAATSTSSQQSATTTASAAATSSTSATLPARDTTPPVRSLGSPSGVLPMQLGETRVSLVTNEPANCYWSNTPNTPFELMATPFTTTGSTMHSSLVRNISRGDFAFFVRCRDRAMNVNTSDYPILFSSEYSVSGIDIYKPRVFMSSPANNDAVTEGPIVLSAAAADNSGIAGVRFFLNDEDLNAEAVRQPYSVTLMLTPGAYTAFAVVRDINDNLATSTSVNFVVTAKPPSATPTKTSLIPASTAYAALASAFFFPQVDLASQMNVLSDAFHDLLNLLRPARQ